MEAWTYSKSWASLHDIVKPRWQLARYTENSHINWALCLIHVTSNHHHILKRYILLYSHSAVCCNMDYLLVDKTFPSLLSAEWGPFSCWRNLFFIEADQYKTLIVLLRPSCHHCVKNELTSPSVCSSSLTFLSFPQIFSVLLWSLSWGKKL